MKSTGNNISTFISEDFSAKYNTSEQAMHDHDCDNTDLHEEIASLEAAIAAKQRDIGLLQQDVNRLQLENVVIRWSWRNLVSAIQNDENDGSA